MEKAQNFLQPRNTEAKPQIIIPNTPDDLLKIEKIKKPNIISKANEQKEKKKY